MTDYVASVRAPNGFEYGTLANADIGPIVTELNGAGTASVTLATIDDDANLLLPGRELHITRDSEVVFWGPIMRPQLGLRTSTWQASGLLWYFGRRYIGKADRENLLLNGDFESGETDWAFFPGLTHSIDTGTTISGSNSLELEGGDVDNATYAYQGFTHGAYGHPLGDYMTVNAYVYVPSADYSGPAIQGRGLFAIHRNAAGDTLNIAFDGGEIDDATQKDTWVPLEVGLPGVKDTDTIEVRLYGPHGVAFYDLVTLTLMESLSFGYPAGTDAAGIAGNVVDYAQDNYGFTHGKSDLLIGTDTPFSDINLVRTYQFVEHRNILDVIDELAVAGGFDFDVAIDGTDRTFTTYAKVTDSRGFGKGSYLSGEALTLDTNVANFTVSWDGQVAASSVVVTGPGDGPGRPEGSAIDAGGFEGLTLEHVESAPDGTLIRELDAQAEDVLATLSQPVVVEVVTYPAGSAITGLEVGDSTDLNLVYGCCTVDDVYRLVRKSLDPKTDQATLTFNPIP